MYLLRKINIALSLLIILIFSSPVFADGFIIIPPPPHPPRPLPPHGFHPFPLEVKYHRVAVKIEDQIAVTRIDQAFYNPSHHRLEGYYLFPIPRGAVIKKFSMYIDGRETEAELLDAKKARKIYEDIVRRLKDPALLEYSDTGVFKVRIFPIEPRSTKRVKMSYTEVLNKDDHTIEYLYPLNTEKFSAKPLKDVSIKVDIHSGEEIRSVYCPTHKVEIIRKGDHQAVVGYEERDIKPDIDFKLYYSLSRKELGISLLTYQKRGEDGYFFLNLTPGHGNEGRQVIQKDIAFVLDVSGSMAGKKLEQARQALLFCIENLNRGDRFDIIRFSTEAEALFGRLSTVNRGNLDSAREFIRQLKPIGGTNIEEALSLALDMKRQNSRPYMVIFLTDGKPTIGETDEAALLDKIARFNPKHTRIFTFGIGSEINTHLLDKITETTRAFRTYITPEEDIEVKVSNFYSKVQSPVLTNIKLEFPAGIRTSKIYPRDLPDLFKGSSLSLLGRYRGSGKGKIVLGGRMGEQTRNFEFSGAFAAGDEKYDFIPPLWAARRIGYLLDQIRLHGDSKELVDEITALARDFGIITPYTSYLIVEDEKTRVRRREIREVDQTLGRIAGHDRDFEKKNAEEFSDIRAKSGAPSVRTSKEFQQLNYAQNYAETQQGRGRLDYRDGEGRVQNVMQQVRNVQGRAFYQTGKFWVDSQIQVQKQAQPRRIQFASQEYFDLLRQEPEAAQLLALGQNVRFVLNNTFYEIYE
jgi:Ca-activated chloride channel family protein